MSPALATRPLPAKSSNETASAGAAVHPRIRSGGGRLTLEQRLDSVWEGLRAAGAADCPVCGGGMEPSPAGDRCSGCGAALF